MDLGPIWNIPRQRLSNWIISIYTQRRWQMHCRLRSSIRAVRKTAPGLSMCSSEARQHKGVSAWHVRRQGHSCVQNPAIAVVSHFLLFEPSNALSFLAPEARGAAAMARG